MPSNDNDEEHVIHSKNGNIQIKVNDEAEEVIEGSFDSLTKKYQIGLKKSMRGSDFIFHCIHLLQYECHKKIQITVDHT